MFLFANRLSAIRCRIFHNLALEAELERTIGILATRLGSLNRT